ncbi:MAG: ATP-binding cassette domain-containing protein [Lachnospiraceae bacterium]|nr:ATP-binding cassette domain-containing protein [Lachnospiraceae bacterium]
MEMVLETKSLNKVYGRKKVVDDVNLNIEKGSIYGLIGKNGAGKTTIMRMIAGLAFPTGGDIRLFENDNINSGRKKIGCVIENPAFYGNMTGYQNLLYYNKMMGVKDNSNIEELIRLVGLDPYDKKKTKHYSLGMKQRLAIAVSLVGNPEFLILDEPINGLDPTGIKEIRDIILKLKNEKNITILISSHILGELEKIATHYGMINNGKLIQEFSADKLDTLCRRYVEIKVDNTQEAANILASELNIEGIEVIDNEIIVPQGVYEESLLNKTLALKNIYASTITIKGQDLEDYFVEISGGVK